jgi:hypothetical protein
MPSTAFSNMPRYFASASRSSYNDVLIFIAGAVSAGLLPYHLLLKTFCRFPAPNLQNGGNSKNGKDGHA